MLMTMTAVMMMLMTAIITMIKSQASNVDAGQWFRDMTSA
jgi:hypothetical protein